MSRQSMPSSVAYDETFTPRGLGLRFLDVRNTSVVHIVYSSDATARVFHMTQNDGEYTAGMVDATSGQRYTAARPFWSATWLPLQGSNATPADQSTVIDAVRDKMSADLAGADANAYAVSSVDVESLNGTPVYHVRLTAQDPVAHPLVDLYVDEQSYLVRKAVADFKDNSVTSVTGDVILDFGRVENYWLVTFGQVDATVHAFFRTVSGAAFFSASRFVIPSPSR